MTTIDKPLLKTLREEINAALAEVAKKHGLTIAAGNASYDPSGTATFKLNIAAIADNGKAITPEAVRFSQFATMIGLAPEHLGREFTHGAFTYSITGLKPDIYGKMPIIVERKGGGSFRMATEAVKAALKA